MPDKDDFSTTMRIDITSRMADLPDTQTIRKTPGPKTQFIKRKTIGTSSALGDGVQIVGGKDFHTLLQNLYDGALITKQDGSIVNANIRAINFLRYPKEELCSKKVFDVILGADEELLATILDNLENNQFTLIQAFCVRQDGSTFPAEISVNRLNLSNAAYLSFFVRDITLRREAEDQLRTGFNAIQNSANGIAIADLEANLVYLNSAMRTLLDLPAENDASGRNIREFISDEEAADDIIQAASRHMCWRGELFLRRANESSLVVDASVAPNTNTDGDITGMVISLVDITEKKIAQQKLEQYTEELAERNKQMEEDLDMARDIQEALLPRTFPEVVCAEMNRRIEYAKLYYPSGAVGGDFFDVLDVSPDEVGVFVCDVMGHGMRAALVVATIRGLIEQLDELARDPGAFMTQLNHDYNAIFEKMKDVTFATAFYCMTNIRTGNMRYVSAGHPPPYIIRAADGSVEQVETGQTGTRAPAIGLFDDVTYSYMELTLNEDDLLLLYTDGLGEALDEEHTFYEDGSMQAFLRRNADKTAETILQGLTDDAKAFSGGREFADDVCLFGLKIARTDR